MDYYELRSLAAKLVPRKVALFHETRKAQAVREKGRKGGYQEYKLTEKKFVPQERLLNLQEVSSFVEVSCRAAACPMPLNIDTWDGLICPFKCQYCFANAFRASLYTAFFDNSKTMGFRHCDPAVYKRELEVLMKGRGKDPHSFAPGADVAKAIGMEIPMRFGIRFEDFLADEKQGGISLELLEYLADIEYPLMINTKSSLVGQEKYLNALSRNKARTAVHMTLISADDRLLQVLEPGAPSYAKRLEAMKRLVEAGVRVVPRIEPFLVFVNDDPEFVQKYMEDMKAIGCRNITFDTYSYTAKNPGIRQAFHNIGLDWDRIFLIGADSQALGSLLLGKFMDLFRAEGFSCSTFDMGNVPTNDQAICCEVGEWFRGGFNWGCTVIAAWMITRHPGKKFCWKDFASYVNERGGFLSENLKEEVHRLWNMEGHQSAYSHGWAKGLTAVGNDEDGLIWTYDPTTDFRQELLESVIQ